MKIVEIDLCELAVRMMEAVHGVPRDVSDASEKLDELDEETRAGLLTMARTAGEYFAELNAAAPRLQ